jgi:hypothetical protein
MKMANSYNKCFAPNFRVETAAAQKTKRSGTVASTSAFKTFRSGCFNKRKQKSIDSAILTTSGA